MIVSIEVIRRSFALREALERRPVYDEDVGPPIIIEIENGNPRPRRLDDLLLRVHSAEDIGHRQARFLGDVREVRDGSGSRRRRSSRPLFCVHSEERCAQ